MVTKVVACSNPFIMIPILSMYYLVLPSLHSGLYASVSIIRQSVTPTTWIRPYTSTVHSGTATQPAALYHQPSLGSHMNYVVWDMSLLETFGSVEGTLCSYTQH